MMTVDHIIALKPQSAAALADDWYGLHAKLYRAMGDRVEGEGEQRRTNWQFGLDPRAIVANPAEPPRFVVVRSLPEVAPRISQMSVHTQDTAAAQAGDRVRFFVNVSAIKKNRFKPGLEATKLDGVDRFRRIDASTAIDLLRENGLDPDPEIEGPFTHAVKVQPGRRAAINKRGIVVAGHGTVTDAERLAKAITTGIGRDRTFGFGILIVEPEDARS